MSLNTPHPLWKTCGNNSYEVSKAVIQARFLSGRYRYDKLSSHFVSGGSPICTLCSNGSIGSIEHLLQECNVLQNKRSLLINNLKSNNTISDTSKNIIFKYLSLKNDSTIQLILDCSVLPEVIKAKQDENENILEEIFRFTRSWCYTMYQQRLQLQGKWNKI